MKHLLLRAGLLLPIMVGLAATNYVVDPAHLFSDGRYERGMAEILQRGENVANDTGHDERLAQQLYVAGFRERKQVVVLGSSRVLQVRSSLFGGRTFFNNGITGAGLQDMVAVYELYRSRGLLPELLVLGLDPWMLNRNSGRNTRRPLDVFYEAATRRLGLAEMNDLGLPLAELTEPLELISPSYFQSSIKYLSGNTKTFLAGQPSYYSTSAIASSDVNIKLSDGSVVYSDEYVNRPEDRVRLIAITFAENDPVYSLGNFVELDPNLSHLFNTFVYAAKQDGVNVIFFLPPYHPEAYERLIHSEKYRIIVAAENYFKDVAAREQIKILGSYNPAETGCDSSHFLDGMHPDENCIDKIFSGVGVLK